VEVLTKNKAMGIPMTPSFQRVPFSSLARAGTLLFFILFLTACSAVPTPEQRGQLADTLASSQRWSAVNLPSGLFNLVAYLPTHPVPDERLTVYIEGDGFAWITSTQPSTDPTPRDPLALRLALAQPDGNAAYLARPCQYVDAKASNCHRRYWTDARFALDVVNASDLALSQLKARFGAQKLTLVGYSGGGSIALLLAAHRNDVDQVVTVAGNLDHHAWTTHHRLKPLSESLNPVDNLPELQSILQIHFVGEMDINTTPELAQDFAQRFPVQQRPQIRPEANFDHHCCWVETWPVLWRSITSPRPSLHRD
jgi:hypothetical protein